MIVNRPVIIQSNVDFAKKADVEGSTSIPATVNFIRTVGHETQGDFGGALYKRASSAADITDGSGGFWDRREPIITPQMCGTGVGAGSAVADSAAMQLAVDSGYPVFLPRLSVPYKFSDITLPHACQIYGETYGPPNGQVTSAANFLINGDGAAPVFKVGTYGSGVTTKRFIRIHGISAYNDGDTVLQLHNTPDFSVSDCTFSAINLAANEATVDVKFSVRGHIHHCRISASGSGSWALQGLDNCNGADWSHNIISGGSAGGAVNLGQTQAMSLRGTVIEASLIGFQVAEDSGLCSAIDLSNFYIEQVRDPFKLGLTFAINGIRADNGYVGNSVTDTIAARNACWQIGRVRGLHVRGGYFAGASTEDFLQFYNNASAPTEMTRSVIQVAERTGYVNDITYDSGVSALSKLQIMGNNEIHLSETKSFGTRKEWVSQPITCNVSVTQRGITVPTTDGGQVESAGIIEATGSLDGTLSLGSSASVAEVLNQNLASLTITENTSPLTLSARLIRAGLPLTIRHVAGSATTTYRLRVVYRT